MAVDEGIRSKDSSCLNEIFRKLSKSGRDSSQNYVLLIQHSLSSHLRRTAVSDLLIASTEAHVYRRAGLRTPAESSLRDLQGDFWVQYITQSLCKEFEAVIWLRTLTKRSQGLTNSTSNLHVMDAAHVQDPLGWTVHS